MKIIGILAAFGLLALFGCGNGSKPDEVEAPGPSPPRKAAAKQSPGVKKTAYPEEKATGAIEGQVRFQGDRTVPKPIPMDSNPDCHRLHASAPLFYENFMVNADGGLKNALVYVREGLEQYEFETPATPVWLDQKGCRYEPHVFGIMVDQELKIQNSDETSHTVRLVAELNPQGNFTQLKGRIDRLRFETPETGLYFKCDIHPWMAAYAGVFEHPKFAVSAADGSFAIEGLLPGTYTVTAWHEKFKTGPRTLKVTVEDGKRAATAFTFGNE